MGGVSDITVCVEPGGMSGFVVAQHGCSALSLPEECRGKRRDNRLLVGRYGGARSRVHGNGGAVVNGVVNVRHAAGVIHCPAPSFEMLPSRKGNAMCVSRVPSHPRGTNAARVRQEPV